MASTAQGGHDGEAERAVEGASGAASLTPEQQEELNQAVVDAARYGETEELVAALRQGADVDFAATGGSTALHMACANGHIDAVRILLSRRAVHVPNESGNTPLHWAVLNGHNDVVALLLGRVDDIDVFSQNHSGQSPLDLAFRRGEEALTVLLLQHKSAAHLDKQPVGAVTEEEAALEEETPVDAGEGGAEEVKEAES